MNTKTLDKDKRNVTEPLAKIANDIRAFEKRTNRSMPTEIVKQAAPEPRRRAGQAPRFASSRIKPTSFAPFKPLNRRNTNVDLVRFTNADRDQRQ